MKKNYRNDGKSYDDALQNKFTAYMDKALRNNMINLLERSLKYKVSEDFVSIEETQDVCDISAEEEVIGGTALADWLNWPDWVDIVFVAMGILTMLAGSLRYLQQLIKMFDKVESGAGTSEVSHSRRDHDYYDDSIKKKRL